MLTIRVFPECQFWEGLKKESTELACDTSVGNPE